MKQLFENLGAGDKEMRTFLRLLELGAQPASVIARHMVIPRSTMYLVLENLKKLGLVEEFGRVGMKYFKCVPVGQIVDVLKARENEIQYTMNLLDDSLSELESLENKLSITPKVRFFEGKRAVMKMYEEVLKAKQFYAFFNPDFVKKVMPEYHYKIPETLKKNNGKAKELLVDCKEAYVYRDRFNSKNHQVKVLPKGIVFASDTIICEDRVYMISYGEKEVSATEIQNLSLAKTQREIFKQLWNQPALSKSQKS